MTRVIFALFIVFLASCGGAGEHFDLLITGGNVIDGTGAEGFPADVGVRDGRIAAIGDLDGATADRVIEADGLVVAPGFIDMHNHSDTALVRDPHCQSMIRQGVTTMMLGEGGSEGPRHATGGRRGGGDWTTLGGYFDYVEANPAATNICSYIGQGQVWRFVKGDEMTPATSEEIEAMKAEVEKAMNEGAMGLSSQLLSPPSNLTTVDQLVELAKVAAAHGGIFSSHIRTEGEGILDAVREVIAVGRGANIPVDIIHIKIADQRLWGRMNEVIGLIQKAREEGIDVRANIYPYTASQNNLSSIIPPWAHDGGRDEMLKRLQDRAARERMKKEIKEGLPNWYNHYQAVGFDWSRVLLVNMSAPENQPFVGKRMSELVEARGGDSVDVLFDVLLAEGGSVPAVYFNQDEKDMTYALTQPFTSIGSDGTAVDAEQARESTHPHPRYYGTFPRLLGRYVREQGVLTLPEAIHKMTWMNADKLSIADRGKIEEGFAADITLFDPDTVIDNATFEDPHQYPDGIPYVIVNGEVVLDNYEHTGARPGRVIRHTM